jgi:hypothetical protein
MDMRTWLAAVSLGLAITAAVFVLVWPIYAAFGPDGSIVKRATLLEVDRAGAIIPVLFPVGIALIAVFFRGRAVRVIAAVLMTAFSFLGGMSIGLYYLPAAILMILAACVADQVG